MFDFASTGARQLFSPDLQRTRGFAARANHASGHRAIYSPSSGYGRINSDLPGNGYRDTNKAAHRSGANLAQTVHFFDGAEGSDMLHAAATRMIFPTHGRSFATRVVIRWVRHSMWTMNKESVSRSACKGVNGEHSDCLISLVSHRRKKARLRRRFQVASG